MVIVRWPNKGAYEIYVCFFVFPFIFSSFSFIYSVSCDFLDGSEIVVHPEMSVGKFAVLFLGVQ